MIYCVEDDAGIRELMIYTLQASDLQAKGLPDADAFWAAMEKEKPKLILLDIMLPGEDGISILKKLKAQSTTADIPVIMATAKGTEYDKVIGLDLGADDYLAKPFGMMELISRVMTNRGGSPPMPRGSRSAGRRVYTPSPAGTSCSFSSARQAG